MKISAASGKELFVSIIIPLHAISDRFFHDLRKFNTLHYTHFEILIISDTYVKIQNIKNIRLILTNRKETGPAEKRDIGIREAKGSIYAFIDDDAYPNKDWLKTAVQHFIRNIDVIGVGGPGITPPNESFMAHLGGVVYESKYTSGQSIYRFVSKHQKKQIVYDWPAYNLFVRSDAIKRVKGWGSTYYGGEDTYLCLKLIEEGFILYDPDVVVYHHRRPLFIPHMKQVFNVGMHRGYFFKKYPKTSRLIFYTQPTVLTLGFWFLFFYSFFSMPIRIIFLTLFAVFYGLSVLSVIKKVTIGKSLIVGLGVILTHMSYGIAFIVGLFSSKIHK